MTEQDIQNELLNSFGITTTSTVISKDALIKALTHRIEQLLEGNPDQLFSMLYRLDISEKNIKKAMTDEQGFSFIIAHLIYDRQVEKIISRKLNKSDKPDDDLAW